MNDGHLKQNDYLEFKNPIHVVWRKGTPEDPYVDRLDVMPVVNQRIILSEIPDYLSRIRIANMEEINHERFINQTIQRDEFYCDYTNGFVYFHASREADTISIIYKGRGVILYPSSRIVHITGETSYETMHTIIEKSKQQIQDLIGYTENYQKYIEQLLVTIGVAEDTILDAQKVTQDAHDATDRVNEAHKTTQLIWKEFVNNRDEIDEKYPYPETGWTTQTTDDGIRWRFDGEEWIPIDILGGSVPNATELVDGLMSKEDFKKLKEISPLSNQKTMVFVLPMEHYEGVQPLHHVFEFSGDIVGVTGSVASPTPHGDTVIRVEKSRDFEDWQPVTNDFVIPFGEFRAVDVEVIDSRAEFDDIFRIYLVETNGTSNMSINIHVNLDTENEVDTEEENE